MCPLQEGGGQGEEARLRRCWALQRLRCVVVVLLLTPIASAQTTTVFDEDDGGEAAVYEASEGAVTTGNDQLELVNGRMPLTTEAATSGTVSGRIAYTHGTGAWQLLVGAPGFAALDLSAADSLSVYLNGPADIPGAVRQDIRALEPISLVNVLFGVKVDRPPEPLSWIYLPFPEQGPANRVTFFSNYSPENAPDGYASFMAEVTHRGELRPDAAWARDLGTALGRAGVLDDRAIEVTHWVDNKFAYIDQNLAFEARIGRVRNWFDDSGYITFGRFGRYEYHNSDQCIARAMEVHGHVREIAKSGDPARPAFA